MPVERVQHDRDLAGAVGVQLAHQQDALAVGAHVVRGPGVVEEPPDEARATRAQVERRRAFDGDAEERIAVPVVKRASGRVPLRLVTATW